MDTSTRHLLALGRECFRAKNYGEALGSYKRALKDAPGSKVLKRNIAAARQADARSNGDTKAQISATMKVPSGMTM